MILESLKQPHKRSRKGTRLRNYIQMKTNYFHTQEGRFYNFLQDGWYTAAQAERALKLRISNITVYKRNLEKLNVLWVGKEVKCPETGRLAHLLTTNRDLAVVELPHFFEGIQADLFTIKLEDYTKIDDQDEIELQDYFEQSMQKDQDHQALFEQDMFEYMDKVFNEGFNISL